MLSEPERQLARIAVQRRYLTGTQLCLCVESRRTSADPLEKIFVDRGFLTPEEVEELVRLSKEAPAAPPMFGDLLRESGLASEMQIHEASELKARLATQNIHRYLGEILVERQVISTRQVTELLEIPTISVGAGPHTDGQLLVWTDWAGLTIGRVPKFVKQYADLSGTLAQAAREWRADVEAGSYPNAEHSYE